MEKIKFTKKQRRIIIVLMSINLFAFFVNYANLDWNIEYKDNNSRVIGNIVAYERIYLFTNNNSKDQFWPIVNFFKGHDSIGRSYINYKFAGLFVGFDFKEFIFYSFLIIGIPLLRKIW